MAMGMMMLSPLIVSLPFKLMLFVLNFRPGYAANINDYLPEKLSTRLAEESVDVYKRQT